MRLCSITPLGGGWYRLRGYEAGHAAASSFEDSSASTGTRPLVLRLIGNHHLDGTPRWRHFLRANGVIPSSAAALSTNSQSSAGFPMPTICRDDLSSRQGTTRGAPQKDILSNVVTMKGDDSSEAELMALIRERTRQARVAMGWDIETMADALGVTPAAYKKYEERKSSTIPTKKVRKFCVLTGVDGNWLMGHEPAKVRARHTI